MHFGFELTSNLSAAGGRRDNRASADLSTASLADQKDRATGRRGDGLTGRKAIVLCLQWQQTVQSQLWTFGSSCVYSPYNVEPKRGVASIGRTPRPLTGAAQTLQPCPYYYFLKTMLFSNLVFPSVQKVVILNTSLPMWLRY